MQQPIFRPKPKPKAKKVDKINPAAIKGLTPEEEIRLEEAKKAEEARKIQEEQERAEKAKKLAEDRVSKRTELQKKMEKSRQLQIERDMRARAKQDQSIETFRTEDLRHQLTSQIYDVDEPSGEPQYKRKVAPNTVTLEIDEDDDLLPIRRNRSLSDTSTNTTSTDEDEATKPLAKTPHASSDKRTGGGATLSQYSQGLVSMKSTYRTGMSLNVVLLFKNNRPTCFVSISLETQEQALDFDTESSTYTTIGETLKNEQTHVPKELETTSDPVCDQREEHVTQNEGQKTSIVTSEVIKTLCKNIGNAVGFILKCIYKNT
ncbi:hypothetical protein TCAL_16045 [Tigriopus californicus]|uniref:Uncharacterized protein n=1 Tax=Tigriopus californicus TaxID=6832 RepID=A0A553PNS1_TIGCA|nr:hypothetical protein TCAL_16045 [Tigriopus californicus]